MSVTPEIEADILRRHASNPLRFSPFRVAKQVGATIGEVLAVINQKKDEVIVFDGAVDRQRLEPFIVASRQASNPGWDNEDDGVQMARARFCAGTHDMATHRENGWLHLCSFPLVVRRKPRPGYFNLGAS